MSKTKQNALETKQISLTMSLKWYEELTAIAKVYGLTVQEVIKQQIGELLNLLPSKTQIEQQRQER